MRTLRGHGAIGIAAAWLLAAFIGSILAALLAVSLIGAGAASMRVRLAPGWYQGNPFIALASGIALQTVLLAGALRQGRILGDGDRRAGLGMAPIQRRAVISILVALLLCYDVCLFVVMEHWPALRNLGLKAAPIVLRPMHIAAGMQWASLALQFGFVGVLAPIAEELFFRGWLWVGLRRVWDNAPVMIVTALAWLAMHLVEGAYRPVFLIPTAVLLTAMRYIGASVEASLAGHLANNALPFASLAMTDLASRFTLFR